MRRLYSDRAESLSHLLLKYLSTIVDRRKSNPAVTAEMTFKKDLLQIADNLIPSPSVNLITRCNSALTLRSAWYVYLHIQDAYRRRGLQRFSFDGPRPLLEKYDSVLFENCEFIDTEITVKLQYDGVLCIVGWFTSSTLACSVNNYVLGDLQMHADSTGQQLEHRLILLSEWRPRVFCFRRTTPAVHPRICLELAVTWSATGGGQRTTISPHSPVPSAFHQSRQTQWMVLKTNGGHSERQWQPDWKQRHSCCGRLCAMAMKYSKKLVMRTKTLFALIGEHRETVITYLASTVHLLFASCYSHWIIDVNLLFMCYQ